MRRGWMLAAAAVAAGLALPAAASAQDFTVSVIEPQNLWDPDFIEADVGQSVLWRFRTPDDQPVEVPHDVQLFAGEEPTGEPLADSGFHIPGNPDSPQSLEYTFEDEGAFTYICSIHSNTMRGSVQVGDDTPPTHPKLYLGLKRKRARGKAGKVTAFTPVIRNTGDALMQDAMVCAKARKRLVKVTNGRCASYAGLDEGESRQPKFTFKPTKRARGKKVTIKFIASATGLPSKTKRATIKVRG